MIALGNPNGLAGSVTAGIVSALDRGGQQLAQVHRFALAAHQIGRAAVIHQVPAALRDLALVVVHRERLGSLFHLLGRPGQADQFLAEVIEELDDEPAVEALEAVLDRWFAEHG